MSGEKLPTPPADFAPMYIARRYISADIRAGHAAPAYAQGWKNVVNTGNEGRDVEIARRLNLGESLASVARAYGLNSIRITDGSR
jgi:hypothetical protein